jgi:dihydroflavonol-4-reductase
MNIPNNDSRSQTAPVLVTGGTGFLGAYIIRELIEGGYPVRAICRSDRRPFFIPSSILDQVDWVKGDILDITGLEETMAGVETVIHSAAMISLVSSERQEMFKTNIEGTSNLVNAALSQNIRKLIHVSSVAALGRSENGAILSEGKQWEKIGLNTNYAISKYLSEMEVWRAIGEGLDAAIVNPSTLVGYGDWNESSCAIFKYIYQESPWYTHGVNGFVSVRDVARAIVLLMKSGVNGERFVLNGENWSFRRLFDTIADGFSKKHPWREAGPISAKIAWRWEGLKSMFTGQPPLITKESVRVALAKTYFDNTKILQYFPGFTFQPLEQALGEACQDYLASIGGVLH